MEDKKIALKARIENDFTYHSPTAEMQPKFAAIREKAKELAMLIVDVCPASREQSVALTELETAVMFANASIARSE